MRCLIAAIGSRSLRATLTGPVATVKASDDRASGRYDSPSMNFLEMCPCCAPQRFVIAANPAQSFIVYS